ncbi:S8 family peptidase [Bacillus dakarensis]|uniref:S8 family peptidase n=1 Tax=Robertmurraya dakarensis TaxID=1926278 RepID=UPI000981E413|nr:S8 family serine peptidase [Bacillus dakarensis]
MALTENRILVGFYPNVSRAERDQVHQDIGATLVKELKEIHLDIVTVPINQVSTSCANYQANNKVRYAEEDIEIHLNGLCRRIVPNDPEYDLQWGLEKIMAPEAWCRAVRSSNDVNIVIMDTGVDQNHLDLEGRITKNMSFTVPAGTVDDNYGHGTHVAGIAAAITNNNQFGAGTSFNSGNIWNYKVLGDTGTGSISWAIAAIIDAANTGAHIINMSFGHYGFVQAEQDAVDFAWSRGVLLIGSAGNDDNDNDIIPHYPSDYSNVISVAATDENDLKADFSNFGETNVDIAAPGVDIFSTCPNHPNSIGCLNFGSLSGTSMSAPFVTGLGALIKATFPSLTNAQIRQAIESSTDTVPGTGTQYRLGRINALKAMIAAEGLA